MEFTTIYELALNNGLWAALFVGLMIYILRDTAKREKKYQEMHEENQIIIKDLSQSLSVVKKIKEDITEIKTNIGKTKRGG